MRDMGLVPKVLTIRHQYWTGSSFECSGAKQERRIRVTGKASEFTQVKNRDSSSARPGSEPVRCCCFACSSKPGSIFCDLDPNCLKELDQLRQTSMYPAGATVFLEADQPRAVYCVGAGRVKLSRSSPDGRAVVVGIATKGDVLGVRPLLLGERHDITAETLEESRLCFVPKNVFLGFLKRNGDVSLRLAQRLSVELGEAYRQVCGVVFKPTPERLAELLLSLCQTQGEPVPEGIGLKTHMCQDELAERVGASRRSLNRALGILRSQGLIECRRRFIIVRDFAALQNWLIPSV